MHPWVRLLGLPALLCLGCSHATTPATGSKVNAAEGSQAAFASLNHGAAGSGQWRGFDRNDFPGDDVMANMIKANEGFAFTGYWLTNPPGENADTWTGKRALLRDQGWGFLVLANGRLDKQLLAAGKAGTTAASLGRRDAAADVAIARHEGFPVHTILFLDQEEGGRLLAEQAAYLLAWTEAVAATDFRSGVYASGQAVQDAPGVTIDTIQDIRAHVTAGKLHPVAIFDALDQCPPAPGCTMQPKTLSAAPDAGLVAWQYAQSPRRPEVTRSCGATYAADGNCYATGFPRVFLDLDVSASPDPSNGR